MFEERTDILRQHIAYLEGFLAEESDRTEDADSEELRCFLETCGEDIDALKSDLPYDEIDDGDIPIEDFDGEHLDDSEIEDEVVEVESVILELQQLMEDASERFLDEKENSDVEGHSVVKSSNLSEPEFRQRLEDWLTKEIRKKYELKGISKSDGEIAEMRNNMIECAYVNKVNPYPNFSVGLSHITSQIIKEYRLLGRLMNFDQVLDFHYSFWEDVI